jgi:hypothetical protein
MGDNVPGVIWGGDVQTDFGEYGVGVDDAASVWGGRPVAPPRLDPTLSNAARVNHSPYAAAHYPVEGFGTKRHRFRESADLAARRAALQQGLSLAEAGGEVLMVPPGAEVADEMGGANGGALDGWGQMQLSMGQGGFRGRSNFGGAREGLLEGGLADRDVLVLIFLLVLYLVMQTVVDSAVQTALMRAGVAVSRKPPT